MRVTSRTVFRAAVAAILATGFLSASRGVHAQIPDKFTNLKVINKKIAKDDLIQTMRGFSSSLGVRCDYCHAQKAGASMTQGHVPLDFASDEKPTKGTARKMLRMVSDINGKYLTKLEPKAKLEVGCVTCHHGVARPEPLASIMKRTVADSGSTIAVARYEALRGTYYGSASYDFTEASLDNAAESLLKDGKAADAVALLELNAQHNTPGGRMQALMGDAYLATGDKDKARAAYQKSLEANPDNPRVKKALEGLGAQ
jgi:tetratricopeptide (TPR) repeat protein